MRGERREETYKRGDEMREENNGMSNGNKYVHI